MATVVALGTTATDTITGFTGVVTGRAEYITGCTQILLQPRWRKPDGDLIESRWFDEQRLTVDPIADVVRLENDATPGSDKAAPRI